MNERPAESLVAPDVAVDAIMGVSAWAREMRIQIGEISRCALGVLISEPNGKGKELIARAVHAVSNRSDKPFIPVDCGAAVSELFPSHLFGTIEGAFTGARQSLGCFRAVAGGTLFFDEIGELDLHLQAQLLRIFEERTIVPVGGVHPIPVDARIIAATSRDLHQEVLAGRFRRDLHHRLNMIELKTIPLKERPEEIAGLARHFVVVFCQKLGLSAAELSEAVENQLRDYDWPGNVRELRNVMERVLLVNDGHELTPKCLSLLLCLSTNNEVPRRDAGSPPSASTSAGERRPESGEPWLRLSAVERAHLQKTLEQTFYNQTAAAALLGITRRVLFRLMKKHGLGDSRSHRPQLALNAVPVLGTGALGAVLPTAPKTSTAGRQIVET